MSKKSDAKAVLLKELGLDAIAAKILKRKKGKGKIMKAIDNFKYVTQDDIDSFEKEMQQYGKELAFTKLKDYEALPPDDALIALKAAKDLKCFDEFLVAFIRKVKDPILFGKINDFKQLYFYIAQWGDDVKIEDIIGTE